MKKRIVLPSIVALSILIIALQASNVLTDNLTNYSPIAQKIAEQLDIDAEEAEEVYDEEKDERRAESFAYFADRLDNLVDEGEITEVQREDLLDKHEEIQDALEEYQYLSTKEKREKLEAIHGDFANWLKEQDIEEGLITSVTA
jgi:flagellar motility protein MotE (MotC chaperone)